MTSLQTEKRSGRGMSHEGWRCIIEHAGVLEVYDKSIGRISCGRLWNTKRVSECMRVLEERDECRMPNFIFIS